MRSGTSTRNTRDYIPVCDQSPSKSQPVVHKYGEHEIHQTGPETYHVATLPRKGNNEFGFRYLSSAREYAAKRPKTKDSRRRPTFDRDYIPVLDARDQVKYQPFYVQHPVTKQEKYFGENDIQKANQTAQQWANETKQTVQRRDIRSGGGASSFRPQRDAGPDWMQKIDQRQLMEYWRMSQGYATSRHDRMLWTSGRYAKEHPETSSTGAYKALSRALGY